MTEHPTPDDLRGTPRDIMRRYQRLRLRELQARHAREREALERRQQEDLDRLQDTLEAQALHLEGALTPETENLTYGALNQAAAAELRGRVNVRPAERHEVAALNTYLSAHPTGPAGVLARLPYWDAPEVRERLAKAMR